VDDSKSPATDRLQGEQGFQGKLGSGFGPKAEHQVKTSLQVQRSECHWGRRQSDPGVQLSLVSHTCFLFVPQFSSRACAHPLCPAQEPGFLCWGQQS
jgi:hypothetical protein